MFSCHLSVSPCTYFVCFVAESVRKQYPDATDAQMRDVIANWLAGSRDRDNGKRERVDAKRAKDAGQTRLPFS